jgi:hypothetical protein
VRLRYTGEHPVSFTGHGVGHVEPGDEFEVPADDAGRFTRRADVEFATRSQKAKATKAEAAAEAETGAEEETAKPEAATD